jgi:hypothetical protein
LATLTDAMLKTGIQFSDFEPWIVGWYSLEVLLSSLWKSISGGLRQMIDPHAGYPRVFALYETKLGWRRHSALDASRDNAPAGRCPILG